MRVTGGGKLLANLCGDTPFAITPVMASAIKLISTSSASDKRTEIAHQIWEILLDNQWAIGTVGLSPAIQGVRVVSNNLGNMPDRQANSAVIDNPAGARPEQWYFKN